jgi:hypothetical protein
MRRIQVLSLLSDWDLEFLSEGLATLTGKVPNLTVRTNIDTCKALQSRHCPLPCDPARLTCITALETTFQSCSNLLTDKHSGLQMLKFICALRSRDMIDAEGRMGFDIGKSIQISANHQMSKLVLNHSARPTSKPATRRTLRMKR